MSVHRELQKSTQSHSKPKEGSMAGGIVLMTSDHTPEIQTNTANTPDRETSGTEQRNQQRCQNMQLKKKKKRQPIQKSGDSQTEYLLVEPSG